MTKEEEGKVGTVLSMGEAKKMLQLEEIDHMHTVQCDIIVGNVETFESI